MPFRTAVLGFSEAGSLNLHGDPAIYFEMESTKPDSAIFANSKMESELGLCPRESFQGAVIDGGAQRSVIGLHQALTYCKEANMTYCPSVSARRFRFGDNIVPSKGQILIQIPLKHGVMPVIVDVVKLHVPLLLGLDLMDPHGLELHNTKNTLLSAREKSNTPLKRKNGHCYLEFNLSSLQQQQDISTTNYTRSQLFRIHKHLNHASTSKIVTLLKRADPEKHD